MKRFLYMAVTFISIMSMQGCNGYHGPMEGQWDHMMGYGYGFGGMLMWILLVIIIGVIVYFIIQSTRAKTPDGKPQEAPMDILKKRYAKGEITKEEYERMKHDLEI